MSNMIRPSIDDMLANRTTRYALVVGVAKRAREIAAQFQDDGIVTDEKPVLLAVEDFKHHRYSILEPDVNE